MQTNKSLAVKIWDTVFGETLKSSVEERDESRQNKLETVKLTAPLPPPVSFLFLFIVLFTVALNSPLLSCRLMYEPKRRWRWCTRENRRLTAGALEPDGRQIRQLYFDFLWFTALSFFFLFCSFFFIPHALVSTLDRSKMLCSFFLPHPSNSFVVSKHCFREFEIIFFARVSFCLITRRIKSNFTQDHIS